MENSRVTRKKKKKRKALKIFLIVIGVLVILVAGAAAKVFFDVKKTTKNMSADIGVETSDKIQKEKPFAMLLLGVDERQGDRGRSDTIILATVNPNEKSTIMLSIPRDTYVEIVGRGTQDKINHAYAFGGIQMSKDTVEKFLDLDIDYVMQVNMEGFQDLVDLVGPITVNNERAFSQDGYTFNQGPVSLNGKKALSYVRMRKEDPQGDFGRQNRQRQVIEASAKEMLSMKSVMNYKDFLNVAGDNVRMNMTFEDVLGLRKGYAQSLNTVKQLSFTKGKGTKINGIYYYIPNEQELSEIKDELHTHLGK